MSWPPRPAEEADLVPLARLWHDAWHEAHAALVPAALTRIRTPGSFRARLPGFGDRLRTVGPAGAPLGLCAIREDHLGQLTTASEARGTGLAALLLADGEARLRAAGVTLARLDVAPGNTRAARVSTRQGWHERGIEPGAVHAPGGPFQLDLLVFEKRLTA